MKRGRVSPGGRLRDLDARGYDQPHNARRRAQPAADWNEGEVRSIRGVPVGLWHRPRVPILACSRCGDPLLPDEALLAAPDRAWLACSEACAEALLDAEG